MKEDCLTILCKRHSAVPFTHFIIFLYKNFIIEPIKIIDPQTLYSPHPSFCAEFQQQTILPL